MAHGPDTDELIRKLAQAKRTNRIRLEYLDLTSLSELPDNILWLSCDHTKIKELPKLPIYLTRLQCDNTEIARLPELPIHLKALICFKTRITELPELPANLKFLDFSNTRVSELPSLPTQLTMLYCSNTLITELPELPANLIELQCEGCPLVLQRKEGESILEYESRWKVYREEKASKQRTQERCRAVKEELVATVMHPRRIERLLEVGGWGALECF